MISNIRQLRFAIFALLATSIAHGGLQPLDDTELDTVSGASGLTIDIDYATTQDISVAPTPDGELWLSFGNSNINATITGLTFDVADIAGVSGGGIYIGLPDTISFEDFNTGSLFLSPDSSIVTDSMASNYYYQTPDAERETMNFQVIATAFGHSLSDFQNNMNDNSYAVEIQDTSGNRSGNLRILDWDRVPNFSGSCVNIFPIASPFCSHVPRIQLCNASNDDGSCTNRTTAFDAGNGVVRFHGGYGQIGSSIFPHVRQGYDNLSTSNTPLGSFGSAVTDGSRDARVSFSLDKQTSVRIAMNTLSCYGVGCGYDPTTTGSEYLNSALVLTDADGRVLDADISSGGGNECGDYNNCTAASSGISTAEDGLTRALIEIDIGDIYVKNVTDRKLGGLVIGAPLEQDFPIPGTAQTGLNARGSINMGGGISVFGL